MSRFPLILPFYHAKVVNCSYRIARLPPFGKRKPSFFAQCTALPRPQARFLWESVHTPSGFAPERAAANTPSVCSLRSQPPSPRGRLNSLSQSLTALTAPSEREPLAYPQTLCPNRKLYRHAKGPILEDDFPRSGGRCRAATKRGICRRRRLGEYPQMPSRENEIAERPQTLRYLEIKNNFSADHAQSARGGHSKSSSTAPPWPSAPPFAGR